VPRRRLGVVLLLQGAVAEQVDGLRLACGDRALGRVPPHVTLVPPVNVRSEVLDDALADVRDAAAAEQGPLDLVIGPAVSFLPDNPVLYLRVDGSGLETVVRIRERILRGPLARHITWPFVPHVTLADGAPEERIRAAELALADYTATVDIRSIHVLEEGPDRVWAPLAEAPLSPPRVLGRGSISVEVSVTEDPGPEVRRRMAGRGWTVTARRHGTVVGHAVGVAAGPTCTLLVLEVDEDLRRLGIGRHLLVAIEEHARTLGCAEVVAHVEAGRAGLATVLRSTGWERSAQTTTYRRTVA
jgi:GNAT superfamily N-acetyltransferase